MTDETEEACQKVLERLERKKGESTFREYKRHVRQFREWLNDGVGLTVFEASSIDVEDMVDDMLDDGYSPSSIRVRRAALSEFYGQAIRLDGERIEVDISESPIEDISLTEWEEIRSKEKEREYTSENDVPYLKPDQIRKLADNVPQPATRNELLVRLGFQTGLRRKELVRLKIDDVDQTTRRVVVREENAKNGQKRVVRYQPSLDVLLTRWVDNVRPTVAMAGKSDYLFPSNRSLHISGQQFNTVVKTAAENAGIQSVAYVNKSGQKKKNVTAHILRHSFAMAAIDNEWDLYVLKDALGHSSVEVTEMYLHRDEERTLSAFENKGPRSS
ncbi:hypothetical protein DP107_02060 [Haloglomus irregulare]|jgi:integrase/recombinase XerD|uniref:Site-specific recombinase XerD n=1 Tax=Haloglomus irregulare TaxID=2234134 RepID=A0A554NF37_9EURY|nr:tyrosine-type recombinase/integrase [Haloglomus irregulare]TSD15991.1 hypothetical protein DP107_02060 [Haloglomus irregulare]